MRHPNSSAALRSERDSGRIGKRAAEIVAVYGERVLIDREVMAALGFTDPNKVRPRITELVLAGVLDECGWRIDPETGKKVRQTRLVAAELIVQPSLFT